MALEHAVRALAQPFAQLERQAERVGKGLCGLLRPHQVARINGVEALPLARFARKPHGEPLRLGEPRVGQRNVDVALDALDAVPGRLAVTDEQDLRGRHRGAPPGKNQGRTCSQNVTGPSLTSDTCMSAPNSPVSTIG